MNTGIIAAFKERYEIVINMIHSGDMIGLFVGHDHANDSVNEYEGLYIGYGRKTGYGCYGPPKGYAIIIIL